MWYGKCNVIWSYLFLWHWRNNVHYFVFAEGWECAQLRLDNLFPIPGINQQELYSWTACLFQLLLRNFNVYEPVWLCVVILGLNPSGSSDFVWSLFKIEMRMEIKMVVFWSVILNFPEMTYMLLSKEKVPSLWKLFAVRRNNLNDLGSFFARIIFFAPLFLSHCL